MLNRFARFLLVATSLSPILGAVAVIQFENNRDWLQWTPWLLATLLLAFLCWALLSLALRNGSRQSLAISEYERTDKEIVAFLLAYLLPLISSDEMTFNGNWITGTYILVITYLVVAHAGVLHFNPVMGLLGFHFYSVRTECGTSVLLMSKQVLNKSKNSIDCVQIADDIYISIGG